MTVRKVGGVFVGWVVLLGGGCDTGLKQTAPPPVQEVVPQSQAAAQEVLEGRCVVCHACYDAPCQLNLQTFPGLDRGASKAVVYDGARLLEAEPSRLDVDATSTAGWRAKGFYPVLPEPQVDESKGGDGGVLMRLVALKAANPLPRGRLDPKVFDVSVERDNYCPNPSEIDHYVERHPQWGMPFGLPGLPPEEYSALSQWLATGAVPIPHRPLAPAYQAEVDRWESFLNSTDLKGRLISRYVFEHLFLGTIYLSEAGTGERFKLVRSETPPGEQIRLLASRRPYDDPGAGPMYYRLQRDIGTLVRKRHMPYLLNDARMQRWRELFYDAPFDVTTWPGYAPDVASNPFIAFQQLPVVSRYRFMLDEARFTIDGFIKGPVCRGQIALNVINDRFWVYFTDPAVMEKIGDDAFLAEHQQELSLPAELGSDELRPLAWRRFARQEGRYLRARVEQLASLPEGRQPELNQIWPGNAWQGGRALTVFRHFDSASVVSGLIGTPPKTAWVIDYSLLERIHYLLVAGYDVYGNVGHQLLSRLYMDFLRISGELQYVRLLPPEIRRRTIEYWYRDAESDIETFVNDALPLMSVPGLPDLGEDPQRALWTRLGERTNASALDRSAGRYADALQPLAAVRGPGATLMPELTYLTIVDGERAETWTVLRDTAHTNVATLFREDKRRIPADDALTVAPGFIGAYPNALFLVPAAEVAEFVALVVAMQSDGDYRALLDAYGVRRSDPRFWQHSDRLHGQLDALDFQERGLLDYSRLENR